MGKVTSSKMCLSLQTYFYFPETDEHINFPIIKLVLVYHFVLKQEIYMIIALLVTRMNKIVAASSSMDAITFRISTTDAWRYIKYEKGGKRKQFKHLLVCISRFFSVHQNVINSLFYSCNFSTYVDTIKGKLVMS